jgi:hypothetical protein
MNNLSTATSTDISGLIGALELDDHLESHSDGVLEATVMSPPATNQMHKCTNFARVCVGDGVLEAAGEFAGPSPVRTTPQGACWPRTQFCISDSALEAAGANEAQPTGFTCKTQPAMCGY